MYMQYGKLGLHVYGIVMHPQQIGGGGYGKYENTCSSIHRLENLIILFKNDMYSRPK